MMRLLFIILLLLGTAPAINQFAVYPYDGEQAQWTGNSKGPVNARSCEYAHRTIGTPQKPSVRHVFWAPCGD